MLKIWVVGSMAYFGISWLLLNLVNIFFHEYFLEYFLLVPLLVFYGYVLDEEPTDGNFKLILNTSYAIAYTFASWLAFWGINIIGFIVMCIFFTTCKV